MGERLKGDYRHALDKQWLGHWDCPPGGEEDLIVTIDHFEKGEVVGQNGSKDKKNICYFKECKPLICNVTNMKLIAKALGTPNIDEWEGQKIALYEADERRAEDGKAIRVRPHKPKVTEAYCDDCGQLIKPANGFTVNKIVLRSRQLWDKTLCMDCSIKRKESENVEG